MSRYWRNYLARLFSPTTSLHRAPRTARLRAELLEDRLAPAIYNVTTTADVVDPNDGVLSLREAVLAANASVGAADTINVPAGTYVLTLTGAGEDAAATGDLDISGDLTIQGASAADTIVDGNLTDRVFDIQAGTVTLANLTVRNGVERGAIVLGTSSHPDAFGGGIRSQGTLTISGCVVADNQAIGADETSLPRVGDAYGGGISQSGGALTITDSTIKNNQAIGGNLINSNLDFEFFGGGAEGGGIRVVGGVLTMSRSLITGNQAIGGNANRAVNGNITGGEAIAGGILVFNSPGHQIESSTIVGNRAVGGNGSGPVIGDGGNASGGGLWLSGPGTVSNCTVSGNQAVGGTGTTTGASTQGQGGEARGGGVIAAGGVISNSTITLNSATGGASNRTPGTATGGGLGYRFGAGGTSESLRSTIVAGNTATSAPDIAGTSTSSSLGNNLIGIAGGSGFVNGSKGDQVGTSAVPIDPRLGPLADNGGPTPTHGLLTGSPAINAGSNALGLTTDQRGPGFARVDGPAADVGAFEFQSTAQAQVSSIIVNAGQANTAQRSVVTNLTVTFDRVVSFVGPRENAFRLTRIGPGAPSGDVTLTVDLSGSTAAQTIARLTFSGPLTEGSAATPSLIDGNYTLTVSNAAITGGLASGEYVSRLHRLYGDVNGDRTVNVLDLTAFRSAFGTNAADANYVSYLDFNGDGTINTTDLTQFRNRFGVILP